MSSINRIILTGRLGADPEMRYTTSGKATASFRLAVDRRQKGETDWIPVVAWERLAEVCSEFLTKGKQVAIEGRLQTRTYESKDGQKRTAFEVVADNMQMLGSRSEGEGQAAPPQQQPQRQQRPVSQATQQVVNQAWAAHGPAPDDEVPF